MNCPPTVDVVQQEGFELRRQGSRFVGLCPFADHREDTPSFFIFDDNHWHCFGCQAHGMDSIDFVRKLHGLSFPDALRHLGIKSGPMTAKQKAEMKRRQHRAELVEAFREWEVDASNEAGMYCRLCRKYLDKIKTPDDLEKYGFLYHLLERCRHHLDILTGRDDRAKFQLYQAGYYG